LTTASGGCKDGEEQAEGNEGEEEGSRSVPIGAERSEETHKLMLEVLALVDEGHDGTVAWSVAAQADEEIRDGKVESGEAVGRNAEGRGGDTEKPRKAEVTHIGSMRLLLVRRSARCLMTSKNRGKTNWQPKTVSPNELKTLLVVAGLLECLNRTTGSAGLRRGKGKGKESDEPSPAPSTFPKP
jgi:hypothetical protein